MNIPETKLINIDSIKPDPLNPNKMSKASFGALKKVIQKYGFIVPIITNKDLVIADGYHRWMVAKDLGYTELPVISLDVEEIDRILLRQIMNKLRGQHDEDMDKNEFQALYETGDIQKLLDALPDHSKEITALIEELAKPGIDPEEEIITVSEYERIKSKTKIKRGEVFKLGKHLLMCGDSTDGKEVGLLMLDDKADLVLTDPPYGVDYSKKNEFLNKIDKGNRVQTHIVQDDIKDMGVFLDSVIQNIKNSVADTNSIYITFAGSTLRYLLNSLHKKEFKLHQILVWAKNNHVLGRVDYAYKHELIVYGWFNKHKYYGDFCPSVWEIDKPLKNDLHPTMKPIELFEIAIKNSSKEDHIVLDLFGGSGTTLIACERTNRLCRMMEIDPVYCQIIIDRWEKYTGRKADKLS